MSIQWVLQEQPLSFSPKRTGERLTYGFDFKNIIGSGEGIVSTIWEIEAVRPPGASITGMIVGSPTFNPTQTFQTIKSGTHGALYSVIAQITTNLGHVMEENALLLVTDSAYK